MSRRSGASVVKKDILLELVSRDIKELQRVHSERSGGETLVFTEGEEQTQLLCDHLDHVLMHGLKEFEDGYWPFVTYFTRTELVQQITGLRRVTTSVGKSRAWLLSALNEQSMESYVRMFAENQNIVDKFYLREAFLRDLEHLLLLLTLVSGLDFISFDFPLDSDYLDYGASRLSSQITSHRNLEVTPTFLSSKVNITAGGRSRTLSDPTPKPPGAITAQSRGSRREKRDEAGFTGSEKSHKQSRHTRPNTEIENKDNLSRNEGAEVDVPIPSADGSHPSMMSSSLQTTSSRNVLERMSSLEKRSPFLERAASREGVRSKGRGEEVEGEGEDVLVAKGRKSGRSKKRRRRRNEENDGALDPVSDNTPSDHVTGQGSHVTGHVIPGALFDPKSTRDDSTQAGAPQLMKTAEECDFETEPKSAVVPGEGEGEGEGGVGMSLEMELALATMEEEPSPVIETTTDCRGEGGHQLEQPHHLSAPSEVAPTKSEEFSEILPHTTPSGHENPFSSGDGEKRSPPSPSLPPSLSSNSRGPLTKQGRSHTTHHSQQATPTVYSEQTPQNVPLDSKPISFSVSLSLSSSSSLATHRLESRGQREGTPEIDGGYDIITQKEVRELNGGRGRANALYSESGEREGEGEGDLVSEVRTYHEPPRRPKQGTEKEKRANDVKIDETMRVVFSIDIFLPDPEGVTPPPDNTTRQRRSQGADEEAKRLVQVNTSAGLGQYRTGYALVTTEAIYLLRRDGIEGIFSREFGARFRDIDHLVIGLGWQSLELVYRERASKSEQQQLQNCVIITGSEAVSRSLMESIQAAATQCPGFQRVIPRNRDDETHIEAIEKELIKLGSKTSMDIVLYSLVTWEQVRGGGAPEAGPRMGEEARCGLLHFKKKNNNRVGLSSWKQGFFRLVDGTLQQFSSETDKMPRASYPLRGCGGCRRVPGEGRPFVLSVALDNTQQSLLLASATEEDMTQWQQTLCEAVLPVQSMDQCKSPMCTVLVTKEKVHILREDLSREAVHHITCCEVTAVDGISIDHHFPLYCTVSYDDSEDSKGVWLLCFISEFELGKFESALAEMWKEEFQIDLPFSELEDVSVIQRARHATDLMRSTGLRSDSVTKGRTEFTYSSVF